MKITIEPTKEMFDATINNVSVPTRVWVGQTDTGLEIEAYVLSIVPLHVDSPEDAKRLRAESEATGMMKKSSETYNVSGF